VAPFRIGPELSHTVSTHRQTFAGFAKVIEQQPPHAVLGVARFYARTIERHRQAHPGEEDHEAEKIMRFCHFLDTKRVPVGLVGPEKEFYHHMAEKMVKGKEMPSRVLNSFK
jgi:hypothetical protein